MLHLRGLGLLCALFVAAACSDAARKASDADLQNVVESSYDQIIEETEDDSSDAAESEDLPSEGNVESSPDDSTNDQEAIPPLPPVPRTPHRQRHPPTVVHVSPQGNDTRGTGEKAKPFATLERALKSVAAIRSSVPGNLIVSLGGGLYHLSTTVKVNERHIPPSGRLIIASAPQQQAILTSERPIALGPWQKVRENLYKAKVNESFESVPRVLYRRGERLIRARHPNVAWDVGDANRGPRLKASSLESIKEWTVRSVAPLENEESEDAEASRMPEGIRVANETTIAANASGWPFASSEPIRFNCNAPEDTIETPELAVNVIWTQSRFRVQAIVQNETNVRFRFCDEADSLSIQGEPRIKKGQVFFVENHPRLLDSEGEWHFDPKNRELMIFTTTKPSHDEVFSTSEVGTLVEVAGSSPSETVSRVAISRIIFRRTSFNAPNRFGYYDRVGNYRAGITDDSPVGVAAPALAIVRASDVAVVNNLFTKLEGSGVGVHGPSRKIAVRDNRFQRIGVHCLTAGAPRPEDAMAPARQAVSEIRILRNRMTWCGVEYKGGSGVYGRLVHHSLISGNRISFTPFTGIRLGWAVAGYNKMLWCAQHREEETCRNRGVIEEPLMYANKILQNRISDAMMELMDGGAIYVSGKQPNTIIAGNEIVRFQRQNYDHSIDSATRTHAIRLDGGSQMMDVHSNLVRGFRSHLETEAIIWQQTRRNWVSLGVPEEVGCACNNSMSKPNFFMRPDGCRVKLDRFQMTLKLVMAPTTPCLPER